MQIDVFCITPDEELFANIKANCAFTKKWAKNVPAHDGAAVIVGGGPSLCSRLSGIRLRQEHGQKIFALNAAAQYLNKNGIIPDYQVLLDPQPFLKEYIGIAREYLVASQCHPDTLRAVPDDATLWHLAVEGVPEQIPEHDDDYCLVGGGISVGLSALPLVYSMGYRKLHLYGYDSSISDGRGHAYASPLKADANSVSVTVGGKHFVSTLNMVRQAQEFPRVCDELLSRGCLITVDCDGLLRAVVDENNAALAA